MTTFLLATDSVHTTAAACDYLQERAGGDDRVVAVAVADPGTERDAADALNVVPVRLAAPAVTTERRTGDPGPAVVAAADDHGADELVLGAHAGAPGADGVGETARHVLSETDRPAVVVPLPDL